MTDLLKNPSVKGGQISLFHLVVIVLSLTLTLGAWQFSKYQVDKRTGLRFEAARDQALGLISDRMTKYEDALWAGVAAVESHGGDISYLEWRTFTRNLRIDQRYPGINGIGVIHYHTADTLDEYLVEQRQSRPAFRIFPKHDQTIFMPITYIEPEDTNAAAVGLDVAHEINRRTAALASRDTGAAQITGPIVLVQDAAHTPGFLFYAPFYEGGPKSNVDTRQERFIGAVYAPFVVHRLMEGLLSKNLRDVRFSIRDGDELIYDEHSGNDPISDPDPIFSEEVALEIYGRTWTLDMRTNLAFRAENTNTKPTIILIAGLLIEGLIICLLFLMSRANKRAVSYADQMTIALRQEKAKLVSANSELSTKNEELERFAYVASHDLKTPIRGISGLTEMVQEDLEDYFDSPCANPDVAFNLKRIQDRVKRMENLTSGIMKLSRIDALRSSETPVRLQDIIGELVTDLAIGVDQMELIGGDETIRFDQTNFRSILENLIGNAVKYHDDQKDLRIVVTARTEGEKLLVSVRDNGPGIEPKFQDRIFDVFQTLSTVPAPGSSGIGLSIVKKAVERHGGTVTLSSTIGKGATFSFEWPNTADAAKPTPTIRAA